MMSHLFRTQDGNPGPRRYTNLVPDGMHPLARWPERAVALRFGRVVVQAENSKPVDQGSTVNSCGYRCKLARKHGRADAPDYRADGVPYARRSSAIVTGATAITFVLSFVLFWRGECWAYIDPNAGGFLSQILAPLAAIFLSFLFYCRNEIRKFAKSVRDRWKRSHSRGAPHQTAK